MIPAMLLLICLPLMPRSPRWLASKDRWDEALSVLALLRSKADVTDQGVLAELEQIRERVEYEPSRLILGSARHKFN